MGKTGDTGGKPNPPSGRDRRSGAKAARGRANPALSNQNRRIMSKHYAAKHGVRRGPR